MKKYIAIPLFFVYFLAVSGVIIEQVCCNREGFALSATTTDQPAHSCCSQAPTDNTVTFNHQGKKNCCNHKKVVVKTIHDQLSEKAQQLLFSFQSGIFTPNHFGGTTDLPRFEEKASCLINAPPGFWQHIPLYKLHRRLLFYA